MKEVEKRLDTVVEAERRVACVLFLLLILTLDKGEFDGGWEASTVKIVKG